MFLGNFSLIFCNLQPLASLCSYHFDMKDYHVLSMNNPEDTVVDHGIALDIKDVPWAVRQLWAPDAAKKNDKYYLYFPAKDKSDVFYVCRFSPSSQAI